MAKAKKKATASKGNETFMARAGHVAFDNPVGAGGAVVMGLTACLIIANALGLQQGRHPAPLFSTRDGTDTVQLPEPDGRRGDVQIQEISTLVLDLQISLRKIGLYEGPLDGLNGPATERAIRSFERRTGQIETGKASESLLALIHMHGEATVTQQTPVPRRKPRFSGTTAAKPGEAIPPVDADPRLQRVQKTLSDLGYGPLKADGVLGSNTADAIKRFELDRGLPLTGELGPKVIENLEMVSGVTISG
ncbi:MAG: peptidoglycan-binding protein [Roseibium sp.]|uniref:peptidoglycan-binding domain-containing protein n=1 Tax=Roseibium sp. TaxID=1936156 RepID=UPI001AFD93DE|nr:peptidoglycan-binding protein [Roseibium sp.]MBO6928131.1 peptidoglycan-binding protein [Roseibium sp.]